MRVSSLLRAKPSLDRVTRAPVVQRSATALRLPPSTKSTLKLTPRERERPTAGAAKRENEGINVRRVLGLIKSSGLKSPRQPARSFIQPVCYVISQPCTTTHRQFLCAIFPQFFFFLAFLAFFPRSFFHFFANATALARAGSLCARSAQPSFPGPESPSFFPTSAATPHVDGLLIARRFDGKSLSRDLRVARVEMQNFSGTRVR